MSPAAEAIQAPRPQTFHLLLALRRRDVTRADLRKYGMEHDHEGRERLQIPKRIRDVEPEVELHHALVARENEGDPAPVEQQDVEMPVETPVESASVRRGSDAVDDNEERACLRLRAEGKLTTYKMYWNHRPRRRPG